jgi:trehalose 6-phosphate synthase
MNLVCKEYVAAQDPEDPGVLILSRFAGAAIDMRRALLVNPYDAESVANAIAQALDMPLEERRARHQALLAVVSNYDIDRWQQDFMNALRGDNGTTQDLQNLPAVVRPSAGWPASRYAGKTAAIETRG